MVVVTRRMRVNDEDVIRPYTPLRGHDDGTLDFLIKVWDQGLERDGKLTQRYVGIYQWQGQPSDGHSACGRLGGDEGAKFEGLRCFLGGGESCGRD